MKYLSLTALAAFCALRIAALVPDDVHTPAERSLPAPSPVERALPSDTPAPTPALTETPAPTASPAPELPAPDVPVVQESAGAYAAPSYTGPYAELVASFFPDALYMVDVGYAESSGWNENFITGGWWSATNDCGLMQIHMPTHESKFYAHGWDPYIDCFDPAKNLTIAREIFDTSGPGAWTTY